MKKFFVTVFAAISCCTLSGCGLGTTGATVAQPTEATTGQDILGSVLGNALSGVTGNTGSLIGNIVSTFAGGITTNKSTIVGKWTYVQPCIQFESENLLAKAGGSLVATRAEAKLADLYNKIGIKPGALTFVFNNDNTCQYAVGSRVMQGKYVFDSATKTMTITTQTGMQIKAFVSVTGNNMGLTFDVSKLLQLVSGISAKSSSLGSLTSIIGNFSGMKAGFTFSK